MCDYPADPQREVQKVLKGRVEMTNEPRDRRLAVGGESRVWRRRAAVALAAFFLLSVVFLFVL